jgi:hypothetical protein
MSAASPNPPRGQALLQVLRLIWIAHLASLAVFAGVGIAVSGSVSAAPDAAALLRPALVVVSVIVALASLWWRRSLATSPRSPFYLFAEEDVATGAQPVAEGTGITRLQTNCIIVWALSESVAVFGLVLTILSGVPSDVVPFLAGTVVLLYVHRPAAWPLARVLGRGLRGPSS